MSRESSPCKELFSTKSVRFDDTCKQHDGLKPSSRIFDTIVWQYFMSGYNGMEVIETADSFRRFFKFQDLYLIEEVKELLKDLKIRLESSDSCHVPVLASGGGFGGRLTKCKHMSSLCSLEKLFSEYIEQTIQGEVLSASESNDSDGSSSFEDMKANVFEDLSYNFDFEDTTCSDVNLNEFFKQEMTEDERIAWEEPKWLS